MKRLSVLLFVLWAATLFAHSGGLDKNGCHTNKKTGEYHCHGSPKTSTPKPAPTPKPKTSTTTSLPAVGAVESSPSPGTKIEDYYFAEVVEIEDGDTVVVKRGNGSRVRIRLYGIDCPEGKQQKGDSAKRYVTDLLKGKSVFVSTREIDHYRRTVASLKIGEDSVSEKIIRGGWGWWYKKYAPKETTLEQAEAEARAFKRGLWADAFPMAPWEYRRLYPEKAESPAPAPTVSTLKSTLTQETTVYVTKTGSKYHRAGCRYLKSSIPMHLSEAKSRYSPCSVCKPQ